MGKSQSTKKEFGIQYGKEKETESAILRNAALGHDKPLATTPYPECDTMLQCYNKVIETKSHQPFLGTRENLGENKWGEYKFRTYGKCNEIITNFAKGMLELDLCPIVDELDGMPLRFLGIYAKNREEWIMADIADWMISCTTIALYDTLGQDNLSYIIKQTEMNTILIAPECIKNIIQQREIGNCMEVKNLITLEPPTEGEKASLKSFGIKVHSFWDVAEKGEGSEEKLIPATGDSLATICYTSGTTGVPKGVMLTQKNILSSGWGLRSHPSVMSLIHEKSFALSYLPLAHMFERMIWNMSIILGLKLGFYHGIILELKEDLQCLKPTFIVSVPRLFNRFYDIISLKINEAKGFKRKLITKAVNVKLSNLRSGAKYTHVLYDQLVFKKMKNILGGKIEMMACGAAPIEGEVLEMLKICFCCPIIEGFGQTENGASGTVSNMEDPLSGHIGPPMMSAELKLINVPEMNYTVNDMGNFDGQLVPMPRGELLIRGPCVSKHGYFKEVEKTRETFQGEWLYTGDIAVFLPGGRIKIIDRKKNFFKLAQGEFIAAEKLENVYIMSPYVSQIFVHGDGKRNFLIAIVVPDTEYLLAQAKKLGITTQDLESICKEKQMVDLVIADLKKLANLHKFNKLEQIKRLYLSADPFSVEEGTLTPTMKMKRIEARTKYTKTIDELYA